MRAALIQMMVTADKGLNIQTACGKIREAAQHSQRRGLCRAAGDVLLPL